MTAVQQPCSSRVQQPCVAASAGDNHLLTKVLLVVGRVRINLRERFEQILVVELRHLRKRPEDRLLTKQPRAHLAIGLEHDRDAVHRRRVLRKGARARA